MRVDPLLHLLADGGHHPPLLPLCLLEGESCLGAGVTAMLMCCQVVQEYERAVIFRIGRLLSGGSKGPGKSFCVSSRLQVVFGFASF